MWICNTTRIPINILLGFFIQVTIAADEQWLVYTSSDGDSGGVAVWPLSANGTNGTLIGAEETPCECWATALTFDFDDKKIFWATDDPVDTYNSTIFVANIDGTSSKIVLDLSEVYNVVIISGLAFDWINKILYLAREHDKEIRACDLSSQICVVLVRDFNYNPFRIALHPQSGTMVWTSRGKISAIFKASMDGSNPTEIVAGNGILGSIVIDHALSRLYWVDVLHKTISTSDFDGANVSTLKTIGNISIEAVGLAVLGPDIYWFDKRNYSFKKCNKNDGSLYKVEKPGMGLSKFTGIDFDMFLMGSESQPNDRVNHCANQSCSHVCVLSDKSYRCMCPDGFILSQDGQHCEGTGPKILISSSGGTHVLDLATLKMQTVSDSSPSWGLSYDFRNSKIYWVAGNNGSTIFRSDWNGSGIESVVNVSGRHPISSLAYDWIAHNIYYTNGDHIGVCDNSGTNCAVLIDVSQNNPFGIALFPRSGLMFWNGRFPHTSITRANMDGSSAKSTWMEIDPGSNLVFDNRDSQLYRWKNLRTIVTTDLDLHTLRTYDASVTKSIAVGSEWFYWTDDEIIRRCEKYDCPEPKLVKVFDWNETVFAMSLFHREGQLQDRINHCAGGFCSHICLLSEKYFRCICPSGTSLMDDSRTCAESEIVENFKNITYDSVSSYKPIIFKAEDDNRGRFGYRESLKKWICANGTFVDLADLCNGTLECPDGTDESQYCDIPCSKINLTDDGRECLRTPNGPQILCPQGYLPAADKRTCEDVDECLESICENDCINTNGSYECRDFPESSDPLGVALAAAIPTIVAIALIGVAIFFGVKYIQTRKILRKLTPEEVQEFLHGDENAANTIDCGADKAMLMPFRLVIQPEKILLAKDAVLGIGQFGVVYRGFYEGDAVAIKTFKRTVEIEEFKAVLAEAKIMAYIGDQVNVVKFIGADVSRVADRKLYLVTELSPHGDLLGYLRKIEPSVWAQQITDTHRAIVSPTNLVEWCEQIACGMQYLEAVKIVHGDLAARNILVFKNNVVKISDFGLSKQLYGNSEYMIKRQRKLPWKWCALELLTRLEFSTDSDIWAFGVTAWEIFSLGRQPYDQLAIGPEFIQYLEQGHHLPKPTYATTGIYEILKSCWNVERSSRPRFATLKEFFQEGSTKAGINSHVENWMASRVDYGYTKV